MTAEDVQAACEEHIALNRGLDLVPASATPLKVKDIGSSSEVRWCPGCGDYAILAGFKSVMVDLGIDPDSTVIVSGIGCSSRFPYYVESYGMHSIHGRAPAIATGLATARDDLAVFVITGDGDSLSIGGNHLIHALRRNVNLTILMFNNQIYGLTKGQYSPTSEQGKVTKSSPFGSLEQPFNPLRLALGAQGTFVARTVDSNRKHLVETLTAAAKHKGASFVEIYQNCPIFNDGAFTLAEDSPDTLLTLVPGEPLTFGEDGKYCVVNSGFAGLAIKETAEVDPGDIVVHDPSLPDSSYAYALAQFTARNDLPVIPIGVYRQVEQPDYGSMARQQVAQAIGDTQLHDETIQKIITGADTWTV